MQQRTLGLLEVMFTPKCINSVANLIHLRLQFRNIRVQLLLLLHWARLARLFPDLQQITTYKDRILITSWKECLQDAAATQRRGQQTLDAKSECYSVKPPRAFGTLPRLLITICHHCDQQVDQNQCREKDVHRKHHPETNDRVEQ